MRKFIICALFCAALCFVSGCSKSLDYNDYVSETRTEIYIYADDETQVKVYCSRREQPFAADGCRGEMCDVVEIFAAFSHNPVQVEASVEGHTGEMSYQAVQNRYYLGFSAQAFGKDSLSVTLNCDGESKTVDALNVKSAGTMSCSEALKCVTEHDPELFESLTENGIFRGEIYVRLIYDEGCYYYVGVCDGGGSISAYLVDGERGKIIATKKLSGN